MTYEVLVTGRDGSSQTFSVELTAVVRGPAEGRKNSDGGRSASTKFACKMNGALLGDIDVAMLQGSLLSLLVEGKSYEARRDQQGEQNEVQIGEQRYVVEVRDPRSLRARRGCGTASDGPKRITAPMPGKVIRILAPEGTRVDAGQGILVIEAMKMQNELKSPKAGVVRKMTAIEGVTVNPGDALAIID